MTDKTSHDVTDDDRRLAREWAESIESATNSVESTTNPWSDRIRAAVRVILDAAPTLPTLAGMTDEERRECRRMQADVKGMKGSRVIAYPGDGGEMTQIMLPNGLVVDIDPENVTPRPDLPRLEWPGDQKPAPAPALPDGWRLAEHPDHGRVIVTRPEPDVDGEATIIRPVPTSIDRARMDWCRPDELTYIDQEADQ